MNIISALPYLNPIYTHKPIAYILKRFLKKHKIDVNSTALHNKLIEHPYFPSLLSISEVLTSINVANTAYIIDLNTLKENFEDPILIYLKLSGGVFSILEKVQDGNYHVITQKGETKCLSEVKFKELWEGLILNVETTNPVVNSNSDPHSLDPAYIPYILATCLALITFYILQAQVLEQTIEFSTTLILNITGASISWLLILQHLNKSNLLVDQLCQSETPEGCNTVLNSKTAEILSGISMADAGLIYFTGSTLLLLFVEKSTLFYLLALTGPLFSLYAIYLQGYVIKQWCRLCMAVHSLMFLSFALSIWIYRTWEFSLPATEEFGVFLLPGLMWLLIKPYIKRLKNSQQLQLDYAALKFNPEVFISLINKQPKVNIPKSLKVFSFGKRDAESELTFVSNPFCGPCAIAHSVIDGWLQQNLDFKINIIFIHSAEKDERRRKFVEYLSDTCSSDNLEGVLHAWFASAKKDFTKWAKQWNLKPSPLPYEEQELLKWLEVADVSATPAFFINGYRLPNLYRLEDIRFLISEVPLNSLNKSVNVLQEESMV